MKSYPCAACDGTGIWSETKDCPYCEGTGKSDEEFSDLPELNLSNTNAYAFLHLLQVETGEDCCGTIPNDQLPVLLSRLQMVVAKVSSPFLVTETISDGNVTFCGRSEEYVAHRSAQLLDLFVQARDKGYDVTWG